MLKKHLKNFFITAIMILIAVASSDILLDYTGAENNSALVFVLAVMLISAMTASYFWGLVSSVLGVVFINFFFMYPYAQFNFLISGYPVALISLAIISLFTCTIVIRMRQQTKEAIQREQHTRELYQMNRQLNNERTAIKIEAEMEKMRSNLLRAISHDLRTPLTTIIGSSTLLLEDGKNMDDSEVKQLLTDIRDDSEWLIGMVENLLSITRFQPGETALKTHPEIVEDVISDAVIKTKKRFPDCTININLPPSIIIAPMDSMLIKQVIINLLENAIRHSGDTEHILIDSYQKDSYAVFEISDRGIGLSGLSSGEPQAKAPSGDSSKGLGIGLPVCESIVKAHHGYFERENRPGGGATFRFGLPLQEVIEDE